MPRAPRKSSEPRVASFVYKLCKGCKEEFHPERSGVVFCQTCRKRVCEECGTAFEQTFSKHHKKFCTRKCKIKHQNRTYKIDPEKRAAIKKKARDGQLRANYGITLEDYERMYAAQGGLCDICELPEEYQAKLLNVDHDHETGQVRALLCTRCNCGLGSFRDSDSMLLKAAQYLLKFRNKRN